MGTAAQESRLKYVHQIRGPAVGLFQVEPTTFYDYWDGYLTDHQDLRDRVLEQNGIAHSSLFDGRPDPNLCIWNARFAAMMCRIHYLRIRAPLPEHGDIEGLARYYKKYYNTIYGKATEEEFIENYKLVAE